MGIEHEWIRVAKDTLGKDMQEILQEFEKIDVTKVDEVQYSELLSDIKEHVTILLNSLDIGIAVESGAIAEKNGGQGTLLDKEDSTQDEKKKIADIRKYLGEISDILKFNKRIELLVCCTTSQTEVEKMYKEVRHNLEIDGDGDLVDEELALWRYFENYSISTELTHNQKRLWKIYRKMSVITPNSDIKKTFRALLKEFHVLSLGIPYAGLDIFDDGLKNITTSYNYYEGSLTVFNKKLEVVLEWYDSLGMKEVL